MAIRPEGPILVDFSALRAGFSTHIQWREGDTAQPNIHIQWSASPVLSTEHISFLSASHAAETWSSLTSDTLGALFLVFEFR